MPQDKIDRLIMKAENERRMRVTDRAISAVMTAIEQRAVPLTLPEIAQELHHPITPGLAALVRGLTMSRYLTQIVDYGAVCYTLPTRQKGRMPLPLFPLPY